MKKFKGLLILTVFLIIFMTSSFAWLNISIKGEKINILKAGDLSLILDETSSEGINIEGAVPVSDEKGLSQEGYTFKLVNNGTVAANYIITLDDLEIGTSEERMSDDILKYSLTKNGVEGSNVFLPSIKVNNKRVVDRGVIDAKTTNTYTLKLWMDYDTTNEGMNKIFAAKLNVDVEQENIKVEKSDKTIDINNKTETLGLEEDISNYIVESSDEEVAVIDSLGNIVGKHHGTVVFKVRNKKTGAKKEISVTITKTLKATFVKQLGVENISKEEATCLLKEKEEKSCSITLPEITPEQGYTKVGWSTEKGSHAGTTSMIDISKDSNLYTIVKKDEIVYTATFNKQVTGVSQIESTTVSCTIPSVYNEEKQEESCKIKLPTVEMKEGYSFVGWNTKKDATTGYKGQEEIELDSNKEFYPIVKKDAITLSAKFYKNGADFLDGVQDEVITKTCILEEKYNGEVQDTECSITTPEIKAGSATPNVVGYSENKDAITSDIGSKTSLTLSSNKEYYAITKSDIKTYSARFYKNGAASLDEVQDEFVTRKCNIPSTYNGKVQKSSCRVTSPEIKASSKTPIVLGYSESMDNHTVILNSNTETNISSDVNYYAQTKKDKVIYTATFKVGKNVTSVEKESNTCTIEATYNGDVQGTSCSIEGPSITPKTGYTSVGWSTTNGSTTGSTSLELTENTTFYANATANSYTVEYYDGNTKLGSSGVKVDEELTLTTIAALNGEKSGYTFKGWATTEGSTQVVHNDGATVSNLSTTEGAVVKLYAVFVDDIKPICSFSSTKEIYVTAEDTLTLTCTDEGSKIANTNLQISNFEVSNDSGSIVSVSNPVEIENGYKYTVSIKGLKAGESQSTNGTFTISLKENSIIDNSSNGNIKTTSQTEIVKGLTYTQSYTTSTGVESITSTQTSCTTILTNLTCDVTLPGINASEGYTQDGWYNNTTKVGEQNTSYTLTSSNNNQTLTAKAIANNYTITYDLDGGTIEKENPTSYSVESDRIKLNEPTKEGYKFLGWRDNQDRIASLRIISPEVTLSDDSITYINKTENNSYNFFKMQIWSSDFSVFYEELFRSTTLGKNKNSFENTKYDSGNYLLKIAVNGNLSDASVVVPMYFEKGKTYHFEYNIDTFTSDKVVVSGIRVYQDGGNNTSIPTNIITSGSYGNKHLTALWVKETYTFDYTGDEQVFTVPVTGTYKIETWGAQGGYSIYEDLSAGGYGGYSVGRISLNKGKIIYINVGGKGESLTSRTSEHSSLKGGYNGGGNGESYPSMNEWTAAGGGATHIADKSGLLHTLENYRNSIYIVSGGGGAGGSCISGHENIGGSAGGYIGNSGETSDPSNRKVYGDGGTQDSGGIGSQFGVDDATYGNYAIGRDGTFGQGACPGGGSGGGGGYYGGGSGFWFGPGAGGGSGYIGNPLLTDKAMYCYNCEESSEESTKTISTTCASSTPTEKCAKEGNGYARITLISID